MRRPGTTFKLLAFACFVTVTGLLFANAVTILRMSANNYAALAGVNTSSRNPWNVVTTSFNQNSSGSNSSSHQPQISNTTMNWAGYASTNGTYSAVTANWKVPTIASATNENLAADATWIGIGGDTSNDLIQVGTQNVVENGQLSSGTFYERLPYTAADIPNVNVYPGDQISAAIRQTSPGMWNVFIRDNTNGETYSNNIPYDSSESSAEWIEEAPTSGNNIIPLDNFGSLTFSDATTTRNGKTVALGASNPHSLTMDNDAGQSIANTTPITNSGSSFTVNRTAADNGSSGGSGWTRPDTGRQTWQQSQGWDDFPGQNIGISGNGWGIQQQGQTTYIYFN